MENITFQQRIEAKASGRLLNDLYAASQKLSDVGALIGHDFKPILNVTVYYGYSNRTDIHLNNDSSKAIFEKLLPNYIANVTDEILKKVDEIDWLLSEKNQEQNY